MPPYITEISRKYSGVLHYTTLRLAPLRRIALLHYATLRLAPLRRIALLLHYYYPTLAEAATTAASARRSYNTVAPYYYPTY